LCESEDQAHVFSGKEDHWFRFIRQRDEGFDVELLEGLAGVIGEGQQQELLVLVFHELEGAAQLLVVGDEVG
jgi:hypothetical protein